MFKAGGINNLSPKCQSLEKMLSALTPNDLCECIEDAKQKELERYLETKHFRPRKTGRF